jgi:hypothetical protein
LDVYEEGYDLSDYTWEEMYESYLEEQGRRGSAAIRNQNVYTLPTSSAGTRRGAAAGTRTPAAKPAAPTPAIPKVKYPVAGTPPTKPATPAAARPAATSPAASRPAAAAPRPTATAAAPKPAAAPAAKPAGSAMDQFAKVVKGYLIGEGYADTEEAALVIMANMSEDWKYSIMESMLDLLPKTRTVISNKPEDKRNPLQKYSDATKPLFSGLPQGKTVIQKPQPRGREFTNPPS